MKRILLMTLLALPILSISQELKVKMEGVKINFVADMQNTAGSVGGFVAKILFDTDDLSNSMITGTVDVNTLSTGNDKRDEHLKSADYFDAATYPTMSYTSTAFKLKGDKYVMTGTMKIKDVKREEKIEFSYVDKVFKAECTIQAAHYNLGNFADKKPEKTNVVISFEVPIK